MVNKASNSKNTKVEIAPDSITWSEPNKTFQAAGFIRKNAIYRYRLIIKFQANSD
jgi:hypothetical protein